MHSRLSPLLLPLLIACSPGSPEAAGSQDSKEPIPLMVRVELPQQRPMELTLETIADVISLDEVDVFPEQTGPVVEILAEEGQRVAAGTLLCRLRDTEVKLSLQEAQVRWDEAQQEAGRAQRAHDRNLALAQQSTSGGTSLLSKRDLETSAQALVTALTAQAAAKVAVDRSTFAVSQCSVTSPIDGVVTLREVSLGDTASPASRAFRVVDDLHPRVIFHRPQREMSLLAVGQTLVGTSEALSFAVRGRLERIAPVVDQESGTLKVTAILEPEAGERIPIGILLHLRIVLQRHENALLIPKRAILHEGDQAFFFVVREGRAVRLPLAFGFEDSEFQEVIAADSAAESLTPQDAVVVVGGERLKDGSKVDVVE